MLLYRKALVVAVLCTGMIALQSYAPKHDDDKPKNLKILPKDISEEDLHKVMREYSRALGVRCGYCHVSEKVEGQERPKFDMASDNKPEKKIAREMMVMTEAINKKHLGKMTIDDRAPEQITCVTCHMGRTTPIITTDSLTKK